MSYERLADALNSADPVQLNDLLVKVEMSQFLDRVIGSYLTPAENEFLRILYARSYEHGEPEKFLKISQLQKGHKSCRGLAKTERAIRNIINSLKLKGVLLTKRVTHGVVYIIDFTWEPPEWLQNQPRPKLISQSDRQSNRPKAALIEQSDRQSPSDHDRQSASTHDRQFCAEIYKENTSSENTSLGNTDYTPSPPGSGSNSSRSLSEEGEKKGELERDYIREGFRKYERAEVNLDEVYKVWRAATADTYPDVKQPRRWAPEDRKHVREMFEGIGDPEGYSLTKRLAIMDWSVRNFPTLRRDLDFERGRQIPEILTFKFYYRNQDVFRDAHRDTHPEMHRHANPAAPILPAPIVQHVTADASNPAAPPQPPASPYEQFRQSELAKVRTELGRRLTSKEIDELEDVIRSDWGMALDARLAA